MKEWAAILPLGNGCTAADDRQLVFDTRHHTGKDGEGSRTGVDVLIE